MNNELREIRDRWYSEICWDGACTFSEH